MKKAKVIYNQNLIDLAVQEYGSEWIRGVLQILEHNDVNMADDLEAGTELDIREVNSNDLSLKYLAQRSIHVVTGHYTVEVTDPTGLVAIALSETEVSLTWNDNSDNEFGFEVWRATGSGAFELIQSLPPDSENWNDTTVEAGETYSYKVRANLVFTEVATVTVPFYAPSSLAASPFSENAIYLTWVDNSAAETGYEIWRSAMGGGVGYSRIATVYDAVEFTDSDQLEPDTSYWYKVRAVNASSVSDFTQEVTAKTFNAFVSVWKTDNSGSSNNHQIRIPIVATGNYACIVAWGDGKREILATHDDPKWTHTYASAGTYEVKIYGTFEGLKFDNAGDRLKIIEICRFGDLKLINDEGFPSYFRGCNNLDITDNSASSWNQTFSNNGNSLRRVFAGCYKLSQIPSGFDTSSIDNFSEAFMQCRSLTSFPVINVSSGLSFDNTWNGCWNLTSFPELDFSAIPNDSVNMSFCWNGCYSLTSFPSLDLSCGNSFSSTWNNCRGLTSFPNINLGSGDYGNAWNNCESLISFPAIDLSGGTSFFRTWRSCDAMTMFNASNFSNATNLIQAFEGCRLLTSLSLTTSSSLLLLSSAFSNCSSITSLSISNTSSVTSFYQAFAGWSSYTGAFPTIDTSSGTDFELCFHENEMSSVPKLDLSSAVNCNRMFDSCLNLTAIPAFNLPNMTSAFQFLEGVTVSTASYNNLLVAIEAVNSNSGVTFSGGNSKHSGAGTTARAALVADHSWTITDGGAI